MESFKAVKDRSITYILAVTVVCNAFTILLLYLFMNSYEIFSFLKYALIVFNIYQLYYIGIYLTLKYNIDYDNLYIIGLWGLRKIKIPLASIKGYCTSKGSIKGIKLSGYGNKNFALGKSIIDKIGTTHMFATTNKNIVYFNTDGLNYGISPTNWEQFKNKLSALKIMEQKWEHHHNRNINIHKDKKFFIPFIIVSVIVVIITILPFLLYLYNKLPVQMPLSFNAAFEATKMGTGKQFAFKQMIYGVLNMAILFCMYYVCYFYAKYDKKTAYRYIYVALGSASLFLFMQVKILMVYL